LFDWRPEPLRGQRQKHERSVIIRNVFSPKEFENNMEKILTHKESIRNQCQNFGHVTKLEIFDLHPDGVMQITFQEVEAADMCVATLNNRLYLGRTLSVTTWDGREKFRVEETKEQREERLKKWDKFLEADK
ncbi:HIV Tat-specific factor 1, partial [Halocaridina rubra]